jgi:hypothetical protein
MYVLELLFNELSVYLVTKLYKFSKTQKKL